MVQKGLLLLFIVVEFACFRIDSTERQVGIQPTTYTWSAITDCIQPQNATECSLAQKCTPQPILNGPCIGGFGFQIMRIVVLVIALLFILDWPVPESRAYLGTFAACLLILFPHGCAPVLHSQTGIVEFPSRPRCTVVASTFEDRLAAISLWSRCVRGTNNSSLSREDMLMSPISPTELMLELPYHVSPEIKDAWNEIEYRQMGFLILRYALWCVLFHLEEICDVLDLAVSELRTQLRAPVHKVACSCCVPQPPQVCNDVWNLVLVYADCPKQCTQPRAREFYCRAHGFRLFYTAAVWTLRFLFFFLIAWVGCLVLGLGSESGFSWDGHKNTTPECAELLALGAQCQTQTKPSMVYFTIWLHMQFVFFAILFCLCGGAPQNTSQCAFVWALACLFATGCAILAADQPINCNVPLTTLHELQRAEQAVNCPLLSSRIITRLLYATQATAKQHEVLRQLDPNFMYEFSISVPNAASPTEVIELFCSCLGLALSCVLNRLWGGRLCKRTFRQLDRRWCWCRIKHKPQNPCTCCHAPGHRNRTCTHSSHRVV